MTKKHRVVMLIIAFLVGFYNHTFSQNGQQDFEKGVRDYNQACEKLKTGEAEYAKTLQTETLKEVLTEFKNTTILFLKINANESTESYLKNPTGYYGMLCKLKFAYIHLNYFYNSEMAYSVIIDLQPYLNGEKNWNLPFDYSNEGIGYTVSEENFSSIRLIYFQLMGDACYSLKKYDEMIYNYSKLLELKNLSGLDKAIPLNNLIGVVKQKENKYSNSDLIKYLSLFIQNYPDLRQDEKAILARESSVISFSGALKMIEELAESQEITYQDIARLVDIINTLTKSDISSETLPILYKTVINKYISTKVSTGRNNDYVLQSSPFQMLIKADMHARIIGKSDAGLGLLATNTLALLAYKNNDCEYMQVAGDNFLYWGKPKEAKMYQEMVAPCQAKLKRAESKRIAEQKRANSTFNLYAGTYPFSLLTSADKRDYGAVLNFVTKKSALEFSYLLIQQKKEFNKENYWKGTVDPFKDMSFWDGYYTHVQYKKFGTSYGSTNYYQGYLLGMSSKKYNTMQVDVTENATNQVTNTTFNPTENQYIAMYNFGAMFLFKGVGVDAYCGVGGTYNMFGLGAVVDKTLYTIQNESLQSNKPTSIGLIFRVGLTVGLNFGNGNMR